MRFPSAITQPRYLLMIVLAAYLWFGMQHLTRFVTADEHYWIYERIPQYWDAIADGDWKKTFINDKPGVSLALVSGIGLLFEPEPEKHLYENPDRTLVYDIGNTESLYRAFRLPILIANGLLLIFLFWVIGRLTDPWTALWTTTLTALSPILLGISQIVNPDSLLWSFGAASVFSYFAFLGSGERKLLALTAIFTGLAVLAKYVALILLPFFLALAVFRFLAADGERPPAILAEHLKKDIRSWLMLAIGTLVIVCFFLPALLVDAKYIGEIIMAVPHKTSLSLLGGGLLALLLIDTFALHSRMLFAIRKIGARIAGIFRVVPLFFLILFSGLIAAHNFFPGWDIFALIPFDIKDLSNARYYTDIPNFFESFVLEWNPLVFSLTPVALIGFTALLITLSVTTKRAYTFLAYSFLFFLLLYSVLLIFSNVLATPRYSILLYPLFAFLAALGIRQLCCRPEHVEGSQPKKLRFRYAELVATLIIFLGSLASLSAISPFYFNYTNALLPEPALIHDAWGYGGYEAAQYLNDLPDAKSLTVWSDYYGVCEFFVGKCLSAYTFDRDIVRPGYYVLTRRGEIRYMSRYTRWERLSGLTAYKYYDIPDPDWQLLIGDRPGNFIKVIKIAK